MRLHEIYDNGGITCDRFTVIFDNDDTYFMSGNADQPNGVCMFVGNDIGIKDDKEWLALNELFWHYKLGRLYEPDCDTVGLSVQIERLIAEEEATTNGHPESETPDS